MSIPAFPQDSVLRRHFESAIHFRRLAWLQALPTDSTLRRHAQQQRQAGPADAPARAPARARPAASSAAASAPDTASPARTAPAAARRSGLMGWLSRLFGG